MVGNLTDDDLSINHVQLQASSLNFVASNHMQHTKILLTEMMEV
jgi:hypothetical protein